MLQNDKYLYNNSNSTVSHCDNTETITTNMFQKQLDSIRQVTIAMITFAAQNYYQTVDEEQFHEKRIDLSNKIDYARAIVKNLLY